MSIFILLSEHVKTNVGVIKQIITSPLSKLSLVKLDKALGDEPLFVFSFPLFTSHTFFISYLLHRRATW